VTEPAGRASVGPLRALYFAQFIGLGVFFPFFPRWLEARGCRGASMGAILAIIPAVGVLAPPIVGIAADALGVRAKLLRVGSVLVALSFLALAAFASAGPPGAPLAFAPLAALLLVHALVRAPLLGIGELLVLEAVADRPSRYGAIRIFGSLGFFVAVLLAGRYLDPSAPTVLPLVGAAAYLVVALVALALPSRAPRLEGVSLRSLAGARTHAAFFGAMGLWQLGNAAYDSTFSLHVLACGYDTEIAGRLWALAVFAEVAMMFAGAHLVARVSPRTLLLVGVVTAALRWGLTSVARSLVALSLLQLLHAVTFASTWLAVNARIAALSRLGLGTMQGVLMACLALGSVVGMFGWSTLYGAFGAPIVFGGGAFAALLAAPLVARMRVDTTLDEPSSIAPDAA